MTDKPSEGTRDEAHTAPSIDRTVLELDHVFGVLDHPRRRYLLYALSMDDQWTIGELATKLTAWERDIDETAVTEEQRDRMYVSIYHAHVPRLVDHGVIEFDETAGTISRGDHAEQVFAVLEGAGGSLDSRQEEHADRGYSAGGEEDR